MFDIISAIWSQDFEVLLQLDSFSIVLLLLALVLFLESSFVFLPLPGDGLVLFVGGLVGMGVIELNSALIVLSTAAFTGSLLAYFQGRLIHSTKFMRKIEALAPRAAIPRAERLLKRYGFLSLFISRFVPFVRVLTPMLMGMAKLSLLRAVIIAFLSAISWSAILLLLGAYVMNLPFLADHQELISKWFVLFSVGLMFLAIVTLVYRVIRYNRSRLATSS